MNKNPNNQGDTSDTDLLLLMQLAKEDDDQKEFESTFKVFYNKFKAYIFTICFQYFKHDKSLAEDLMIEIFQKISQKIHTFNPKYSPKSWIGKIANNHIIDIHRQKTTTEKDGEQILMEEEEWDKFIEDTNKHQELSSPYRKALDDAFKQIPNEKHKLILIEYYRRKTYNKEESLKDGELQKIANMFDTSIPNVKKIVQRIYSKLDKLAQKELTKQ